MELAMNKDAAVKRTNNTPDDCWFWKNARKIFVILNLRTGEFELSVCVFWVCDDVFWLEELFSFFWDIFSWFGIANF
jgi:hypothetical protein